MTDVHPLFRAGWYAGEAELLCSLGLRSDVELKHGEWTDLGEHVHTFRDSSRYKVRVAVCTYPAKFWRFTVTPSDGEPVELSTGSGHLKDYWPTVELFAKGMFSAAPITDQAAPQPGEAVLIAGATT